MPSRETHPDRDDIQLTELKEKGRTQFFHHSPDSVLPVRDIVRRGNTEPYIEYGLERGINDDDIIGAENFCSSCVPHAIASYLVTDEKYLFLVTNPWHKKIGEQIVGYLRKEDFADRGDHYAVIGSVRLYAFEDAYPTADLPKKVQRSEVTIGRETTEEILNHFKSKKEITVQCVEEVQRLHGEGTTVPTPPTDCNNGC